MGDNGIIADSGHAEAVATSTNNYSTRKSVCETGGGGRRGTALLGPMLGLAPGEKAVVEG